MRHVSARDRLIVALDMPTLEGARTLVTELDDSVTFYKVGLELAMAGGLQLVGELKHMGKRVFLDMKLLDIAHTVERAVANAAELGATFLTVHGTDLKTMRAAVAGRGSSKLKLLAVTVLTNLTAEDLKEQGSILKPDELVLKRTLMAHQSGFDGVIASGQEAAAIRAATGPDFVIATPGIRLAGSSADDQARITTPEIAIGAGADYIVVGRPISEASDPKPMAEAFVRHIHDGHLAGTRRLV